MVSQDMMQYISEYIDPSDELIKKVEAEIKGGDWDDWDCTDSPLSRVVFKYKDDNFTFKLDRSSNEWQDDYKYEYSSELYHLISFNEDYSIKTSYNLFFEVPVSRTGSYFTGYSYLYCYPTIKKAYIKEIPEVIIPAHKELDFEEI